MPSKPLMGLRLFRRAKPKTRKQKLAKSSAAMRDERLKNLEKARRVRKKNLRKAKLSGR